MSYLYLIYLQVRHEAMAHKIVDEELQPGARCLVGQQALHMLQKQQAGLVHAIDIAHRPRTQCLGGTSCLGCVSVAGLSIKMLQIRGAGLIWVVVSAIG